MKKISYLLFLLTFTTLLFAFKKPSEKFKSLSFSNSKSLNNNSTTSVPQATADFAPLLRYYNSVARKHFLTTNPNELGDGANGYVYEKNLGWLRSVTNGTGIIYRYYDYSINTHYYSLSSSAPSGFSLESIIGSANPAPLVYIPEPITEYYNSGLRDYLYTNDPSAEFLSGYVSQGVVFTIPQTNDGE